MQNLPPIPVKTTYSEEEIAQKRQEYLSVKDAFTKHIGEIYEKLQSLGDDPLTGDDRKEFHKQIEHIKESYLKEFDQTAYNYFEAKESPEEK